MRVVVSILIILFSGLISFRYGQSQVRNPNDLPWEWKTDTTKTIIDLQEIIVVLPRGAFPVLKHPEFVGMEKGMTEYFAKEPVISIELDGRAKAYPLNILTAHEVANDSLGNTPILVSYCPLCNAGLVFDRRLNHMGKRLLLDFEVSGLLRRSDLIMFDRQTESWWQQIEGKAVAGVLTGAELEVIPSMMLSVRDFFERYPNGRIMSKNTGFDELQAFYGTNPYQGYDSPGSKPYPAYFDSTMADPRLPAMERVVNVESGGEHKIYPFNVLAEESVINDSFNGKDVVIFYQPGTVSAVDAFQISESRDVGSATAFNAFLEGTRLKFEADSLCFRDLQSGSCWDITGRCIEGRYKGKQLKLLPHGNYFAFAWLAFYPRSVIYTRNEN